LVQFLTGLPKEYVARVRLGMRTTTDDSDGDVEATSEGWREIDQGTVQAALGDLRGRSWQTPPRFSAKKIDGEAAHYRARRGETVALAPVEVDVLDLELLEWKLPDLELRVRCSAGTYVRALARDLGEALGTGAHLSALRRTAIGDFRVDGALPTAALSDPSLVEQAWITPAAAVAHLPWVEVGPADAARLSQGQAVAVAVTEANSPPSDGLVAVLKGRSLVAVAEREGERIRPRKVFPAMTS
jgi:tRNA pseudouridine55 synthase